MKVQKLSLVFFKNHIDWKWQGDEDVIGLSGLNGVGKTTVLDALHFLCLGKSYFSSTDVQCIHHDELQAGIISQVKDEDDQDISLKIKFKRGGRKSIEKNGVLYKKTTEHIGQFLAVTIAPGDIELIYGTNEKRRAFINQILGQVDKLHLEDLMKYNKLIEHRNKHLKQDQIDLTLVQTLDEQIAPLAHSIYEKRRDFLNTYTSTFSDKYLEISQKKEAVQLIYKSQLETSTYFELVENNRAKDIAVQRSFTGIHKDEIDIEINSQILKKFGSQGQIKSSLIALKLAEYEYLQKETGKTPLLLLDDIFEKIDDERALVLTQLIKNDNFGQIFITDTKVDRINTFCKKIGKSYTVIELN